jgi:hypothetical protein
MKSAAMPTQTPQPLPPPLAVRLDAYPRLCGLPVTIERLVPASLRDPRAAPRRRRRHLWFFS